MPTDPMAQAQQDWQEIEAATAEVRAAIDRLLAAQLAHQRTRRIDTLAAIRIACDQTRADVASVLDQQTMAFQYAAAESTSPR